MNSAAALQQNGSVATDVIQLLSREGYHRLADALRDLIRSSSVPMDVGRPVPSVAGADIEVPVFTPFRPPPLDQGTWLDRARQVAIAQAHLRKEAPEAAASWLDERCGLRFDESQVERAGISLDAQIRAWRRRRLPKPFWLFFHTWRERVFLPAGAECWPATFIVGIDSHGYRVAADFIFGPPGEPQWEDILKSLDTRGIRPESGGLTGRLVPELFSAASARWPHARFQVCQRQFLSRIASGTREASNEFPTRIEGDLAAQRTTLERLLPEEHPLRAWIGQPEPGRPSVISIASLPWQLHSPLASLQWLERDIRNWRTRALQDELMLTPPMKSRLLTAAVIEWEGGLDLKRPFVDPEILAEIQQGDVRHPVSR